MIDESQIEEIARFAFPRADDKELGNKKALVATIAGLPHRERISSFYVLLNNKTLDLDLVDSGVAHIATIDRFEPGRASATINKCRLSYWSNFVPHALCAAAITGNRKFLENLRKNIPPLSDACSYLLERM